MTVGKADFAIVVLVATLEARKVCDVDEAEGSEIPEKPEWFTSICNCDGGSTVLAL